jgi:hypothetical protein
MDEKIRKSEEEWRRELTAEKFRILRQKGTERPFTGLYNEHFEEGVYVCALVAMSYSHRTPSLNRTAAGLLFMRPSQKRRSKSIPTPVSACGAPK